ncbi:MAG: aminotransferase class I/II-fold pyridoxal phosphate-dependent enzyme, partial [Methylocella sp.]
MKSQNRAGLDEQGRRRLDEMVQNRVDALAAGGKTQIARAPVPPSPDGVMNFQNLPGYRELKLQRSMAAVVGLD